MRFRARAATVFQFLTRCASSTMTVSGCPGGDQVEVAAQFLVIGDLAEILRGVFLLALYPAAADDAGIASGKTQDLALPLVLERGRADHQHARHAEMAGEDFGGGNRLDGLAQTHFVADQRPPGGYGEQRAFGLVRVKLHLQQLAEPAFSRAVLVQLGKLAPPLLAVAATGHEIERVVVGTQFVTAFRHQRKEARQGVEAFGHQAPGVVGSENRPRGTVDPAGQSAPGRKWMLRPPSLRR